MRYLTFILIGALFLHSCFEEEEMVAPHEQGDLEEGQAAIGADYGNQVYYDLYENAEVSSNLISKWDLSFESSTGGWTIRLNSSKFMLAGNSFDTTFSTELRASELDMKFDLSNGNPDSTAIGTWYIVADDSSLSHRHVYLVDRGIDEKNKAVGLKKVQFDIHGNDFLVRYGNTE